MKAAGLKSHLEHNLSGIKESIKIRSCIADTTSDKNDYINFLKMIQMGGGQ